MHVAGDLEQRIADALSASFPPAPPWSPTPRRRPRRGRRRRRRPRPTCACRALGLGAARPALRRATTSVSPSPSRSWSPTARWPTAVWRSAGTSTANLTSIIDVERGRELRAGRPAQRRARARPRPSCRLRRVGSRVVDVEQRCRPSTARRRSRSTRPDRSSGWWRPPDVRPVGGDDDATRCVPARRGSTSRRARLAPRRAPAVDGVPARRARRQATCDVQFGAVADRRTPSNSWDAAKFEVCAHRFVDFAEPAFGVAVLDDGRYGHGVQARRGQTVASAWPGRRSTPTRAPTTATTR